VINVVWIMNVMRIVSGDYQIVPKLNICKIKIKKQK
jgi:hypothetical protein